MSRSAWGTPRLAGSTSAGPSASASASTSAAPSRTGTPLEPTTDLYRPLAAVIQRGVASAAGASGAVGSGGVGASTVTAAAGGVGAAGLAPLLGLDAGTYAARLSGKTLLLDPDGPGTPGASASTSALVTGRKRNRGDARALQATKAAQAADAAARKARALRTPRSARNVVGRETKVDYAALLPLHYLHMAYIAQVLGLPACPSDYSTPLPIPPSSAATSAASGPSADPPNSPTIGSHGGRLPFRLPGLSSDTLHSKLVKADFVGAQLRVAASRNASLVGAGGIVLEETAGSFRLAGEDGRVRVVPKHGAQFVIDLPVYAPPKEAPWPDNRGVAAVAAVGGASGGAGGAGGGAGGASGGAGESTADTASDAAVAAPPAAPPAAPVDYALFTANTPRITLTLLGSAFAFRSGERAGRKFRPAQGGEGSGWAHGWVRGEWSFVNDMGEAQPDLRARTRKRNKSRRKDPPAYASVQVF